MNLAAKRVFNLLNLSSCLPVHLQSNVERVRLLAEKMAARHEQSGGAQNVKER